MMNLYDSTLTKISFKRKNDKKNICQPTQTCLVQKNLLKLVYCKCTSFC